MASTLKPMIIKHEDFRSKPYRCSAGKLTIGYGRNLEEGISRDEADYLLNNDIARAGQEAMEIFPRLYAFPVEKQNAIIDMLYNLGKTRFKKFIKMIAAINEEDWERAAEEAKDSRWFKQVKSRGKEIVEIFRR